MPTSSKTTAAAVVSFIALVAFAGCAKSEIDRGTRPQKSVSSASPSDQKMLLSYGEFAHHFETFEDMAAVDVVIAKVVGERDGVIPPAGDGEHASSELRRVITLDVTDVLAGQGLATRLDVQTLGWNIVEGRRTPLTFNGMPWLQVGDEAVIALDDPNNLGQPGFASEAAVQVFRDGRIDPAPVSEGTIAPPLSQDFEGMTKVEVIEAFSKLSVPQVRP